MSSNEAKIGVIAVALVSTWATAQADDFRVTVNPTVNVDNVRVYSRQVKATDVGASRGNQTLSSTGVSLSAGSTYNTTFSTSYSTVATVVGGSPSETFDQADVTVVATTSTSSTTGLVVGKQNGGTAFGYSDTFSANYANSRTAISNGNLSGINALLASSSTFSTGLFTSAQDLPKTGTLYNFDQATGARTEIGTYTVAPVPEPGTFAALGLGALAMLRRRQRKAG